jgi:hypothetical protein
MVEDIGDHRFRRGLAREAKGDTAGALRDFQAAAYKAVYLGEPTGHLTKRLQALVDRDRAGTTPRPQ